MSIVKLLRPNISETIKRDLDILIHFALWISNKSTWAGNIGFLDLAHVLLYRNERRN
ncbi:hypothetical protein ACT7DH_14465 [Bacillus pacificus]